MPHATADHSTEPVDSHLQCPVCAHRHDLRLLHPGRHARCPCGSRLLVPDPTAALDLVPLPQDLIARDDRTRAIRPLTSEERAQPLRPSAPTPRLVPPPADAPWPVVVEHLVDTVVSRRTVPLEVVQMRRLAERLSLAGSFDVLRALPLLRNLTPYDFQQQTVRHVLTRLGGRALLADEVGLGKTIEAACIFKELDVRGLARRVLILTPATLVTQWQEELREKFALHCHVARDAEHWDAFPRIIASLDTAKRDNHAREIHDVHWDLVIVDEAHRLKNRRTRNWKFVNRIRSRYLLLLSATPFQNDLIELFNLITVLRPGQLYSEREFRDRFITRGDRRRCPEPDALRQLLDDVMVRNRRAEVGIQFVPRQGETRRVESTPEQRALYDAALQFCRTWFTALYGATAPLVIVSYLRLLTSSPFRFRESLVNNLLPRARTFADPGSASASPDTDDAPKKAKRDEPPPDIDFDHLLADLHQLIELADAIQDDVKLESLVHDLRQHDERCVVFTHYSGNLPYLAARLEGEGISTIAFHGGMDLAEKDAAIESFRRGEARVLLSTDAGSEGRNLQFCRRVVNYDLPWNPMRIEQRIGRVHRLGQTRDVIVTSYALKDTIEDHLLDLLDRKLNLFKLIVGEVELILGNLRVEQEIARMFLASRHDADFKTRFQKFGAELQALKTDYRHRQQANVDAFSGVTAPA